MRGLHDAPDAELLIHFPDEVETPADRIRRAGRLPAPRHHWRGSIAREQRLARSTQFIVPEPGYYRVQVEVRAPSASPFLDDGERVSNSIAHEVWLLVCESGGRNTGRWGNVSIDRVGGVMGPGPFRGRLACREDAPEGVASDADVVLLSVDCEEEPGLCEEPDDGGGQTGFYGRVEYQNSIRGYATTLGVGNARIRGKTVPNNAWSTAWILTDSLGYFVLPSCPPAGLTGAQIEVFAENDDVTVLDRGIHRDTAFVPDEAIAYLNIDHATCTATAPAARAQVLVTSPYHAELFHNLNVAASEARRQFGAWGSLPKLTTAIDSRDTVNLRAYTWPSAQAGQAVDSITFTDRAGAGTWGQFVTAHEYGHAAHHTTLGGLSQLQACPDSHSVHAAYSMGCAANEGFANFWAVMTRWSQPLDSVHFIYDQIEDNPFVAWFGPVQDGSRVEGAVAAFLLDVADGTGADGAGGVAMQDAVASGPMTVANIVRNCRIHTQTSGSTSFRADAVDHWAYCLEREYQIVIQSSSQPICYDIFAPSCTGNVVNIYPDFHPDVPATYFQTRGGSLPKSWNMGPGNQGSSQPEVRRLWLCNLYRERCMGAVTGPYP